MIRTTLALFAVCSVASSVVLADVPSPSLVMRGHKRDVNAVAVSADSKLVATGGDDNEMHLWDGLTLVGTRASEQGPVKAVAFSPDGKLVFIGSSYGDVTIWDREAKKDRYSNKGHASRIIQAAFFPDGKSFITGSWDHTVKTWDTATGTEKSSVKLGYQVNGVALAVDGTYFVIDSNGSVWVYAPVPKGKVAKPISVALHAGEGRAITLSPDGKTLAVGYGYNQVFFLDVATQKELRHAKVTDAVNSMSFSPDGKTLAVGTQGEDLQLVDVAKGEAAGVLKGHGRPILSVTYSPDGKKIISGSMDMTARSWPIK